MDTLVGLQAWLSLGLGVAAWATMVFSLVDALRQRSDAFSAAGKQTKTVWLVILGVASAIGLIFVATPFNVFNLIAFVAAGVYLADVRPAIRRLTGGGGRSAGGMGPYGPW